MCKSDWLPSHYNAVIKVAHWSSMIFGILPVFIEEAGVFDGVRVDIDDGIVGEFGDLQGVTGRGFVGESEAAVEYDVMFWIERIRVDEDGDVVAE